MKVKFKILLAFIFCVYLLLIGSCTPKEWTYEEPIETPMITYEVPEIEPEPEDDIKIEEPIVEKEEEPIIEEAEEVEKETVEAPVMEEAEIVEEDYPKFISLGEFMLTAYCPCVKCCGVWSGGATASGVMPTANHTIAVDKNVIPFGTEIVINGITYVAEDAGGAIKGNRIDIYMESHWDALNFGIQYAEVFKIVY